MSTTKPVHAEMTQFAVDGGAPIPAHSPSFFAADESIFVGAAVLAEAARVASAALMDPAILPSFPA